MATAPITFAELPAEIRALIWGYVLDEHNGIEWYGSYGPQDHGMMGTHYINRRIMSTTQPRILHNMFSGVYGRYVPPIYLHHPVMAVNKQMANDFRAHYHQAAALRPVTLNVSVYVRILPPGAFSHIHTLCIDMDQALLSLHVVVPNLRQYHTNPLPPTTPLKLWLGEYAGIPTIRELRIEWKFYWELNMAWVRKTQIKTLIARLSYFHRNFQAKIHCIAHEFHHGVRRVIGEMDVLDGPINPPTVLPGKHQEWQEVELEMQDTYLWDPQCMRTITNNRRASIVRAHPRRAHIPLGWRESMTNVTVPAPMPMLPRNRRFDS